MGEADIIQLRDSRPRVRIGARDLRIDDIERIARGDVRLELSNEPAFLERLQRSREHLEQQLEKDARIYGVTTGFGECVKNAIPSELASATARNLLAFHGCGVGEIFDPDLGRAIVAARLASLARGHSAVRPIVLQRLCELHNHGVVPCIPALGSVGASGDLTPLSYVAAVLVGEREVWYRGERVSAHDVHDALELEPLELGAKESLALMNGTSAMTGLACIAVMRARRLARLAATVTAMTSDALLGNAAHFDDRIFELKPHPGQRAVARWIRADLEYDADAHTHPEQLQDRYSIRCAPHVIGVLADAIPFVERLVETELNSVNDNPIVHADDGDILMGGNFYGGHIAFAMDSLKQAVANVADLLDRQLELLVNPQTNHGLPPNLVVTDRDAAGRTHHGFKAMQITASAVTAEALKLTMPASVFSRSTESHNQDKVSMGTISARDALRVLDLVDTVAAVHLLACAQAIDLRERAGHRCTRRSRQMRDAVRERVAMNTADRRQDRDIQAVLELVRDDALPQGRAEISDR